MNFDFSDDAKTMRESARKFLDANAGAAIAQVDERHRHL